MWSSGPERWVQRSGCRKALPESRRQAVLAEYFPAGHVPCLMDILCHPRCSSYIGWSKPIRSPPPHLARPINTHTHTTQHNTHHHHATHSVCVLLAGSLTDSIGQEFFLQSQISQI